MQATNKYDEAAELSLWGCNNNKPTTNILLQLLLLLLLLLKTITTTDDRCLRLILDLRLIFVKCVNICQTFDN